MGDNIYLGDRNGVRTPMQWSPDRNAGFSQANPQRLYAPGHHRPGVPLRGAERRGPAEQPALAALVDEAPHRPARAVPGLRPGHAAVPLSGKPPRARLRPRVRGRADPDRREPVPLRAGGASWISREFQGTDADRDVRTHAVPRRRGRAVLGHPESARLLLVPAPGRVRPRGRDGRRESGAGHLLLRAPGRSWCRGAGGSCLEARAARPTSAGRRWFRGKAREIASVGRHRGRFRCRWGTRRCC